MAAVTICSDFGAQKSKVNHSFHCFPIYLPWVMEPDAMILVFWMLSFKPTFHSLKVWNYVKENLPNMNNHTGLFTPMRFLGQSEQNYVFISGHLKIVL